MPDAPTDFWTPQLFKDELVELTRHLGIAERYAVVGQSWGGMLARSRRSPPTRPCTTP
jgi:L-proline amide hydrolase